MQITREADSCRLLIRVDPIFEVSALARSILAAVQDSDREVELDLQWVEMLHSPSLGELTRVYTSLTRRGVRVSLSGLSAFNRRLLKMTRLDQLFGIA